MIKEVLQNKKHKKAIKEFCLFDNDFMKACMDENKPAIEFMLRIILDKSDLQITDVVPQKDLPNLFGREVVLDVYAVDSKDRKYNIEVQKESVDANVKRARYHSSMLDVHLLDKGEGFDKLPETYVIFITKSDVLKGNLPIYYIDRQIVNQNRPFGNGTHIIYVNGKMRNSDTELSKLMHDFYCTEPDDMNYEIMAERVRYFKKTKEGRKRMSAIMDELVAEGEARGETKSKYEVARRMIARGRDTVEISEDVGLPIKEIEKLKNKLTA